MGTSNKQLRELTLYKNYPLHLREKNWKKFV